MRRLTNSDIMPYGPLVPLLPPWRRLCRNFLWLPIALLGMLLPPSPSLAATSTPSATAALLKALPYQPFTVLRTLPHDRRAFTQGLVYAGGYLYESCGRYNRSDLRVVDARTGKVLQRRKIADHLFGEGLALWDTTLIQLTWKAQTALRYRLPSLSAISTFTYQGEGWGLTTDGHRLIRSDGSSTLYFHDPKTFAVTGRIQVHFGNRRLAYCNELEYINGEIWANVWKFDAIIRIDPATGAIIGALDCSNLLSTAMRRQADVLNGIAYAGERDAIFVTGKLWPQMYVLRLTTPP